MFLFAHCPASSLSNDFGNSARIKSFKPAVLSCTTCDILTEFQQFNLTVLHVQCNKMKPFWAKFVWWVAKLHKTPRRRRISKERARANRKWKRFRSDDRGTRDDSDCAIPNSSLKLVSWTWNNNNPRKKKRLNKLESVSGPGHPVSLSISCDTRVELSLFCSWKSLGDIILRWRDVYLRVSSSDAAAVELQAGNAVTQWETRNGEQVCRVVCAVLKWLMVELNVR